FIARSGRTTKVVVEEQPPSLVPKIFVDFLLALFRPLIPLPGFGGLAQQSADFFQIFFRLIKQTVQTDGSKMMRARAIRSEAEGNVERRLTHAAIPLVVIGAQLNRASGIASRPRHGRSHMP